MTEMSFMRPTQTTGKHQLVTPVDQLCQSPRIILSANPLQGLDHGGCDPLRQPVNCLDLPHVAPEALETTLSASKISSMSLREPTTKDVA